MFVRRPSSTTPGVTALAVVLTEHVDPMEGSGVLAQSTGETRSVFVSDSAASSADVEGHRHPSSLTGKTVRFV